MKVALGRLGWAPDVFWRATPHEFWAAIEGWVEVNCIQRPDTALSVDEVATLEAMKKRFPDRPVHKQ
jgi:uncharacterized phage protein (TIGR02216 family)